MSIFYKQVGAVVVDFLRASVGLFEESEELLAFAGEIQTQVRDDPDSSAVYDLIGTDIHASRDAILARDESLFTELVGTDFRLLPGLLLYWDTGTGKTIAAAAAIIASIGTQAVRASFLVPPQPYGQTLLHSGDALVVGYS